MNKLQEALNKLGSTVNEVAASLKERGVRGKIRSTEICPIAEYLKAEGFQEVSVGGVITMIDAKISSLTFEDEKHTKATGQFIEAFDKGLFPELILDEALGLE